MRVDFELLRTRHWYLQPLTEAGSTWCSLTLDGHYTEVRLFPLEHEGTPPDDFFYATAYVQLLEETGVQISMAEVGQAWHKELC